MKISPIVEYAGLDCHTSAKRNSPTIFDEKACKDHSYWSAVVARLQNSHGLYLFYDSMTRPLYVGIAQKQNIWTRANQSYAKDRGRNGKILAVSHPANNVKYSSDKVKTLKRAGYTLADVSTYLSAYEVDSKDINGLEAFAIRAFGGVLINTKMEGNGGFGLPVLEDK